MVLLVNDAMMEALGIIMICMQVLVIGFALWMMLPSLKALTSKESMQRHAATLSSMLFSPPQQGEDDPQSTNARSSGQHPPRIQIEAPQEDLAASPHVTMRGCPTQASDAERVARGDVGQDEVAIVASPRAASEVSGNQSDFTFWWD
ncbi:hypothetical protein CYMTET_52288 [Cymbomonas tetramitiformis]|uniref:Uncharacterized protein n=1 Tax=Cymbomonas tetramitiformis TaxID=36881 RepID=A0AAE0ESW8_9CHLO|nr:hypothetical protein CYMTET_52288 [Cymbomonas tetramitiformis]